MFSYFVGDLKPTLLFILIDPSLPPAPGVVSATIQRISPLGIGPQCWEVTRGVAPHLYLYGTDLLYLEHTEGANSQCVRVINNVPSRVCESAGYCTHAAVQVPSCLEVMIPNSYLCLFPTLIAHTISLSTTRSAFQFIYIVIPSVPDTGNMP